MHNTSVTFKNGGRFPVILDTKDERFLIYYNKRHLICCRKKVSHGRISCLLMDTCYKELTGSITRLLSNLRECPNLPDFIRYADIDHSCSQQQVHGGGCVVMSLGNLTKCGDDSVDMQTGEYIRSLFLNHMTNVIEKDPDLDIEEITKLEWSFNVHYTNGIDIRNPFSKDSQIEKITYMDINPKP
jgi:hypothetical protein